MYKEEINRKLRILLQFGLPTGQSLPRSRNIFINLMGNQDFTKNLKLEQVIYTNKAETFKIKLNNR